MPAEPTPTRMAASIGSGRRAVPVGGSNVYGASPPGYVPPKSKDNLFLWTVFLLGLVVVCMGTWVGTAVIFNHPEQPLNYNLLRRFKKVQTPQKFAVESAPPGEFTPAGKLAARLAAMAPTEFRDFNASLVRAFIRNFPISAKLPTPYLNGRFTIMDSYTLGPGDVFPSGVVALAVSAEDSKVLIEHVYSAPAATAPLIRRNLPPGTDIELQRTLQLTAVVHAERLVDGRLLLTVVPINYGSYGFKGTSSGFSLEPPPGLNLNAGWPVLKEKRREDANQAFIAFRQRSGTGALARRRNIAPTANSPSPVTGIDAPPPAPPAPGETPALAAATPTPPPAGAGRPSSTTTMTAAVVVAPVAGGATKPSPAPVPSGPVVAMATPPVNPLLDGVRVERAQPVVPAGAPGVLRAAPATANAPGGASLLQPVPLDRTRPAAGKDWPTYAPGRQPAGRQLRAAEVASLGEQPSTGTDPLYLQGEFVVSATGVNPDTGERQVVLRPRDPALFGRTRILVQYPKGRTLPSEGMEVSRDAAHAYQITDVRRTADGGMLNVFAREITTD